MKPYKLIKDRRYDALGEPRYDVVDRVDGETVGLVAKTYEGTYEDEWMGAFKRSDGTWERLRNTFTRRALAAESVWRHATASDVVIRHRAYYAIPEEEGP